MLTIQGKAVKYAKNMEGSFLIKSRVSSVSCCTGNTITDLGFSIEIVKDFRGEEIYNEYEYEGIKIYIENNLMLKENAYIFMLAKIPFMKPFFDAREIGIKAPSTLKL